MWRRRRHRNYSNLVENAAAASQKQGEEGSEINGLSSGGLTSRYRQGGKGEGEPIIPLGTVRSDGLEDGR